MPVVYMNGTNKFSYVEYAGNDIHLLTGPIVVYKPNKNVTVSLDFSRNRMRCLALDVLSLSISYGLRVEKLKLSQNDLGVQLVNDSDGKTFNVYRDLTELDISFNGIKTLPLNIFNGLHYLRILNLSENSLRLIEFSISQMNKLSVLDLSYNLFSNISPSTRKNMNKLTLILNISLSLSGNSLSVVAIQFIFLNG